MASIGLGVIAKQALIHSSVVLLLGLGALYYGFKQWKKYRLIADLSTSKARSMAAGFVELHGKVKPIKTLVSPVSKAKCVYYKVEHQIRRKGGWHTTNVEKEFQNFYVEDETGKIEVDPRQADMDIPKDNVKIGRELFATKRLVEYYLAPGDEVHIVGTAKIKPGVKSADNPENFLITKGENNPFYYISDKKESTLLSKLSRDAYIYLGIGTVVFLGALVFWILGMLCLGANYCYK